MTYKLESFINKITSPIVVECGDKVLEFPNGAAACDKNFNKHMVVDEVKIAGDKICIVLKENESINDVKWCSEKTATFF